MKWIIFSFLVTLYLNSNIYTQQATAEIYDPPRPYHGQFDVWGTDYLVTNTEPLGRPSGVYRTTNNTIYVAVPDTNLTAGRCVVIFASSNNGASWVSTGSVSPALVVPKVKMVCRPGSDSVYCFILIGTIVYSWNVITNNFNQFTAYTNIRDFDAAMTSTNSIYLIYDLVTNNEIRWHGSTNGGVAWGGTIFLTSAGAHPTMYFSGLGDTAVINYKGPIAGTDTLTSAIRNVRYRESVPGTLVIVGSFTTPIAAGTARDQFMGVRNGLNAWIFFTTGVTGGIDFNCISSIDGGTTYGTPVTIGSMPGRDEYWFDAKHYNSGVDIIYYSDSLQGGPPTNSSDRMYNTYALYSTPTTFSTPAQFSEHPPSWSARGYIPTLIEYYDAGSDAGAIWVGFDAANKKLYFDRYSAVTGISHTGNDIPNVFSLSQNYPNPFNPSTKIDFSIPKAGLVMLKVYDMLGREVESLVNKEMKPGFYSAAFDASKYATGIYFYKLVSGGFIETKKMILVK
ncbi:MAG: T9SS type A sorting domain-containing protein [Ignavibacteria bacterium]